MKNKLCFLFLLILVLSSCTKEKKESIELTISAATSLKNVMKTLVPVYMESHPKVRLTVNYGSSGSLQRQIEEGAPVDVFISAASKKMNTLQEKGLLLSGSRIDATKNSLVLIAPKENPLKGFTSLKDKGVTRIALGEPASVPAGRYGQECLKALGLWDQLESKMVFAKDIREVLAWVETGNVDAGLVYKTDALISEKVFLCQEAPEETHESITYPAAVILASPNKQEAQVFTQWLFSPEARKVFAHYGFSQPEEE